MRHNVNRFLFRLLCLSLLSVISACATAPKSLVGVVPGREMETLQSTIGLSMRAGEHSTGGRGFLILKYPDRFHLAVLSPFNLTLLEVFSDGQHITCLVPSKQSAYTGLISELPQTGALRTFGLLKWVVARTSPGEPDATSREFVTSSGDLIRLDQNGLVQRKISPDGDQVTYNGYGNVNGVAFPEAMEINDRFGITVKITFDDPEINTPLEPNALTPNLEGYRILPFSDFKGF